jgi:hypothetical protein
MDKDILKWAIIENIVIIITSGLLAYFLSAWCLLMLLFCNQFRLRNTDNG